MPNSKKNGELVSSDVTVGLLKTAIQSAGAGVTHVLVDGFPRSLDNMTSWNKVVGNEIPV